MRNRLLYFFLFFINLSTISLLYQKLGSNSLNYYRFYLNKDVYLTDKSMREIPPETDNVWEKLQRQNVMENKKICSGSKNAI